MVKLNVRTDKWKIVATRQQKELLQNTVSEFRRLARCLVGVVNTHWSTIGLLDAKSQIPAFVNPRGTSSYADDGSGKLKRNNHSFALARFANSKLYNADLSASYNIGARGILKLCGGNSPEVGQGKNSCPSPRSRGTLSMLWVVPLTL